MNQKLTGISTHNNENRDWGGRITDNVLFRITN